VSASNVITDKRNKTQKHAVIFPALGLSPSPLRAYGLIGPAIPQFLFVNLLPCVSTCVMTYDLDLGPIGSSRIQLDTMGHTPTTFVSVKSCHLCLFPGGPPSFVGLCWLCSCNSLLVDLVGWSSNETLI